MANKTPDFSSPLTIEAAQVEDMQRIINGLSEVIQGFNQGGHGPAIAQTGTIFRNLRYYEISNQRQPLSQAYVELGVVQNIVDVPVDDAFRGGVIVKSKQLSPDQVEELQIEIEQEDDMGKLAQAAKWNRLFGGSGIVTITDQDPMSPFDINAIKEGDPLEFRASDLWELFYDQQNLQGFSAEAYEPNFDYYNYYGKKMDKTRVQKMRGLTAPSLIRPRLRGWGMSVVEVLVRPVNQYIKATDLSFEVLDEFKIDIFKIKNLTESLQSASGESLVTKRLQMANMQKNYQHGMAMDAEDDYMQKQLSFTGIAEMMAQIRMQMAADARMPMSKLFGIPSAGFSSGEDDIEVYNAMVESQVRQKVKFIAIRMIEIRCQQIFGFVPDDLTIEFKPLRMLSSEQEEAVKTSKYNRLLSALQANAISAKTFADACNKDQLLGVQVDPGEAELLTEEADAADQEAQESKPGEKDGKEKGDVGKEKVPVKSPKPKASTTEAPTAKNSILKHIKIKGDE